MLVALLSLNPRCSRPCFSGTGQPGWQGLAGSPFCILPMGLHCPLPSKHWVQQVTRSCTTPGVGQNWPPCPKPGAQSPASETLGCSGFRCWATSLARRPDWPEQTSASQPPAQSHLGAQFPRQNKNANWTVFGLCDELIVVGCTFLVLHFCRWKSCNINTTECEIVW